MTSSIVCKRCHSEVKLLENPVFHHGLGTKLFFVCNNKNCVTHSVNTGFPSTTKSQTRQVYSINTAAVLALRSIGRGRTAALKLFSILNIGAPVSQPAWTKHTAYLTTETAVLVENNMKQATVDLKEMLSN